MTYNVFNGTLNSTLSINHFYCNDFTYLGNDRYLHRHSGCMINHLLVSTTFIWNMGISMCVDCWPLGFVVPNVTTLCCHALFE